MDAQSNPFAEISNTRVNEATKSASHKPPRRPTQPKKSVQLAVPDQAHGTSPSHRRKHHITQLAWNMHGIPFRIYEGMAQGRLPASSKTQGGKRSILLNSGGDITEPIDITDAFDITDASDDDTPRVRPQPLPPTPPRRRSDIANVHVRLRQRCDHRDEHQMLADVHVE